MNKAETDKVDLALSKNQSQLTIKDYLNIVLTNKKKFIIIGLSALVFSIIVAFFIMKPVFLSTGVIKAASNKSSMLGGLLSSTGLSELGDFGDMAAGSGSSSQDLALYENIILSRGIIEEAIVKFNIMEIENFKYMYDAVKFFRENIIILGKDKVAGTMTIGIYDTDPVKAKEIAEYFINSLNKKNIELNVQNARNNRQFIEERYGIVKSDLKKAEDSLEIFQDIYGIAPDLQIQVAAKGSFELEAEIKSEEIKLELLKKMISQDQPEVKSQESKVEALKKQLNEMYNNDFSESKLNLKGSPKIILNYMRLKRELEIQNKILATLIPMLEQSKIEENRETPTILVIDNPNIPDKKAKPKRLYIIIAVVFVSLLLTYLYYYIKLFLAKKSLL